MSSLVSTNSISPMEMIKSVDMIYKYSEILSKSQVVPEHYRNKPADCFVALQRAMDLGINVNYFMEKSYILRGKIGMHAELMINLANKSGLLKSPIYYKEEGEGRNKKVTAFADLKNGHKASYTFSYITAEKEGYTKNSKYQTMPELMLRYRAATLLIRLHIPEALGGLYTIDELEDMRAAEMKEVKEVKNVTPIEDKIDKALDFYQEPVVEKEFQDELSKLVEEYKIPNDTVEKWLDKANVSSISEMPEEIAVKCIEYVRKHYE